MFSEILLFYSNISILLDHGSFSAIVKAIEPDQLVDVIDSKMLKLSFIRKSYGTYSATELGVTTHQFVEF